jgi:hypothetical protein
MDIRRWIGSSAAVTALLSARSSVYRDESDRETLFLDARVRKELRGADIHQGAHLEAGWQSALGDTNGLDYSIGTLQVGVGFDARIEEHGWAGVVTGVAWQYTHFDAPVEDLENEDDIGPYVAVQGDWSVMPWLEPFVRGDFAVYFPDFDTRIGIEAGLRYHFIEHTAVFAGWRYTHYAIQDLDPFLDFDQLELDASGLAVGLELAF